MFTRRRLLTAALAVTPLGLGGRALAQITDVAPDTIAGIPVNYNESLVGAYTLPDPLVMASGATVRDEGTWFDQRRPEILRFFEENQFGRAPGKPAEPTFDVFDAGTPALDGRATRRQVTLYFDRARTGPSMDVLLYLPAEATGPVPVFLNVSFSANSSVVEDPGVEPGVVWSREERAKVPARAGRNFGRLDVMPFLEAGIGVATVYYAALDPDFLDGAELGIRGADLERGRTGPAPDEWGAIAAWSWGLSRVMDYFETDDDVDEDRVVLFGASRVGKTVLWTAARDLRFAGVIASASGEGGAALSRRAYGETIAHLTAPTRYPYQFAGNYAGFGDRVQQFPVDAHMLLALIAPRPVLLQTGTEDRWSDPRGEFEAAVAAGPVFELLGARGLETTTMPGPGQPILHTLGYLLHDGGHGPAPSDWPIFLEFVRIHLLPEP
ncbi:MAG: acetylxylan esterase [Longimicrobiales bacterium]